MPINIKSQKDALVTEAVLELDTDLNALDELMRSIKATGNLRVTYNMGGRMGVNVEQKSRVSEKVSDDVRQLIGIGTRELEEKE